MKFLLTKNRNNWCEDCCDGISTGLSPLLYQTGTYLRREGLEVTIFEYDGSPVHRLEGHDGIILFASLAALDENLPFLKDAKERGLSTILVLHDSFSAEEELMREFDFIDYCVIYPEREIVLKELLLKLEAHQSDDVPGTILQKNGTPFSCGPRPTSSSLRHLSSCAEVLSPILHQHHYTHAYLTVGRGCPHGCSFCDIRRTPTRKRDPQDIIDELSLFQKSRRLRRGISFIDPLFSADPAWTETLCEGLLRERIEVTWRSTTRYDALPENSLLQLWKKAGCIKMGLGLEHLHSPMLKKVNLERFREAVKRLQDVSILPIISIIIGLWEDDSAVLFELENYLHSLGKIEVVATPLMPLKGTPLYYDYRERGLIKELSCRDYQEWGYAKVMFPTSNLAMHEVTQWLDRIHCINPQGRRWLPWRQLAAFLSKKISSY
jgi:radical SAM superfamily enzyme YgiQ (UPF0313 family)